MIGDLLPREYTAEPIPANIDESGSTVRYSWIDYMIGDSTSFTFLKKKTDSRIV